MLFVVLTFLFTGLLIYVGIYYVTPWLIKKGVPKVFAFWMSLWLPVYLLIPLALTHYYFIEQGLFTFEALQSRFILYPMRGWDYGWIILAIIGTLLLEETLQPISRFFAKKKYLAHQTIYRPPLIH